MSTVQRFTSADLLAFPDGDGKRYEIIDGELHVSKQPHTFHQSACIRLAFALNQLDNNGTGVILGAPGLIFSDDNDVAPDLVWISKSRMATALGSDGHLHESPELVVEVLSPGAANIRRDREAKLKLYSRREVQEYWIVDWKLRRIEAFRREGDSLVLAATFQATDMLTSPLFPGRSTSASEVFAGIP